MKFKLFLFFILVSFTFSIHAQDEKKLSEKIYYGGGLGVTFGSVTSVNISPLVGYKFTPKLSAGASLTYQYLKRNDDYYNYESTNYGGGIFARYRFIEQLYAHIEYANINYEYYDLNGEVAFRKWVPFLLVGGGYSSQVGKNSVLYIQVLFDVIGSDYSPYPKGQPVYSMGIGVGF